MILRLIIRLLITKSKPVLVELQDLTSPASISNNTASSAILILHLQTKT